MGKYRTFVRQASLSCPPTVILTLLSVGLIQVKRGLQLVEAFCHVHDFDLVNCENLKAEMTLRSRSSDMVSLWDSCERVGRSATKYR